ncbi:MAG: hypothetical protein LAO04_13635 [Acidobacteriia bacterium]|nr:hypothetical protein [Terriglobia bacterium]
MRKNCSVIPPLLLLIAVGVADDPWKSKPVEDWTREEALQFFRESPWVHRVAIPAAPTHALPSSASVFDGVSLSGAACLSCAESHLPHGAMTVDDKKQPSAESPGLGSGRGSRWGETIYFVQWTSARTVRRALSRLRALDGIEEERSDIAVLLNHVVTVIGADLSAFEGIPEAELANTTQLRARKTKAQAGPTQVRVQRQQDGRITSVHFEFPREIDGRSLIPDEERSVEFFCQAKDLTLKVRFDLTKMVSAEGRDL